MMRVWWMASLSLLAGCPNGPGGFQWERGCIEVDGKGGWLYLEDALTQAEDGSTISLCGDAIVTTITVDRDITIEGPLDPRGLISQWRGVDNEAAATVVAGGSLTVRNVAVFTSRNGFTVEEGGDLLLERVLVQVDQPGSYGIENLGGDVTVDTSAIVDAYWGGIQSNGGTVTVRDSDIVNSLRWGVRLEDGATADITDSLIGGTFISDESGANNDGWGVYVGDGSVATLTNVDLESNVLGGAYVNLGTLDVVGGTWTGNFIGGWFDGGTATLTGVEVIDPLQYGVVSLASTVTLDDVVFDADPASSPFEDPTTGNLDGGYAIIQFDGEITWTGGAAREFNGGGYYGGGNASAQLPVVLTDVSFEDNAGLGIQVELGDVTATDVKVTGTGNPENCLLDGRTYCGWGFAAFSSDVTWNGGSIRDNAEVGFLMSDGPAEVAGLELRDNGAFGIWATSAVVNVTSSEVTGDGYIGLLYEASVGTVTDTVFHDREYTEILKFDTTEYRFFYGAIDVSANESTVTVTNSDFRGGDSAIYGYASTLVVEDSTFDDYNRGGVEVLGGSATVERAAFTRFGGEALICRSNGDLTARRIDVADVTRVASKIETWQDGALFDLSESTYSAPAIRLDSCSASLRAVSVAEVDHQSIRARDSELDLQEIEVRHVGAGELPTTTMMAVDLGWTFANPEADLSEVTVDDVRAGGAMLVRGFADAATSEVSLEKVAIGLDGAIAGEGLVLDELTDLEVRGLDVAGTGQTALRVRHTTGTIDGVDEDGDRTGLVLGAADVAVIFDEATVEARNLDVIAPGGHGVVVRGGPPALIDVTVEQAGGFGMQCSDGADTSSGQATCEGVSLDGALGATDGCSVCVTD